MVSSPAAHTVGVKTHWNLSDQIGKTMKVNEQGKTNLELYKHSLGLPEIENTYKHTPFVCYCGLWHQIFLPMWPSLYSKWTTANNDTLYISVVLLSYTNIALSLFFLLKAVEGAAALCTVFYWLFVMRSSPVKLYYPQFALIRALLKAGADCCGRLLWSVSLTVLRWGGVLSCVCTFLCRPAWQRKPCDFSLCFSIMR